MDFGASNHMTCSSDNHESIQKHDGNLDIKTANGENFPITSRSYISFFAIA